MSKVSHVSNTGCRSREFEALGAVSVGYDSVYYVISAIYPVTIKSPTKNSLQPWGNDHLCVEDYVTLYDEIAHRVLFRDSSETTSPEQGHEKHNSEGHRPR